LLSNVFRPIAGFASAPIGIQELMGTGGGMFLAVVYLMLGAASVVVSVAGIVRGRRRACRSGWLPVVFRDVSPPAF
jgi:hypothetical protein